MENEEKKSPKAHRRFGSLEVAVWDYQTKKGTMYKTTLKRKYVDNEGKHGSTEWLGMKELVVVAWASAWAYETIRKLQAGDKEAKAARAKEAHNSNGHDSYDPAEEVY